jgi:hypothetical protein
MNALFNCVAIPSADFVRALSFYEEITEGVSWHDPDVPFPMVYFVDDLGNPVGHLFQVPSFKSRPPPV